MLLKKEELESMELNQKQFTNSIVRAQKQMEARHFGIRKHLFDYDNVINQQRKRVYGMRDWILEAENDEDKQAKFVEETKIEIEKNMEDIIAKQIENAKNLSQSIPEFLELIKVQFGIKFTAEQIASFTNMWFTDLTKALSVYFVAYLQNLFEKIETKRLYAVFKDVYLHFMDKLRIDHIDEMQYLRDKVWLMWYAQLDPLIVYKKESYDQFVSLLSRFKTDTVSYITSIDFDAIVKQQEQTLTLEAPLGDSEKNFMQILQNASQNAKKVVLERPTMEDSNFKKWENIVYQSEDWFEIFDADDGKIKESDASSHANDKIRPNDACPCGSGKKYKKCHGITD